jgi:hypothetical protein
MNLDGLVAGEKPSLARLGDVSRLVNGFAGMVFALKAGFQAGDPKAKNPLVDIDTEATRCGRIILGQDDRYDAQPWNTRNRLGMTLQYLFPEETRHYGDPGKALFMWLANQMLNISKAVDDGMSEEKAKFHIEEICTDVAGRIIGLGRT